MSGLKVKSQPDPQPVHRVRREGISQLCFLCPEIGTLRDVVRIGYAVRAHIPVLFLNRSSSIVIFLRPGIIKCGMTLGSLERSAEVMPPLQLVPDIIS